MLKKIFYTTCFFLLVTNVVAQQNLKGKVINAESNEPIFGASIYFNNTSIGTTTKESGSFSLSFPNSYNAELIVSSIGYETLVYKLEQLTNRSNFFVFKLIPKASLMNDILILPNETRKKYMAIFKENFVGTTVEANSCRLKNFSSIFFSSVNSDLNIFYAYCDTPLIIYNNRLGYKIYFQLEEFYFNKNTGTTSFWGYTRYQSLGNKKRWKKSRELVYYGSTLHFYRSLINQTLAKENYLIYKIRTDSSISSNGIIKKIGTAVPIFENEIIKKDSSDSSIYVLKGSNKLMVKYTAKKANRNFGNNIVANNINHNGHDSYLNFATKEIFIAKDGVVLNPLSVLCSGFWSYEKVANLLPFDYYPEK